MNIRKITVYLKVLLFILAVSYSFISTEVYAGSAKVYTEGDYYYELNEESIVITGYFGSDSRVELPDKIAGYPVSEIAKGAFIGTTIKELVLPPTIMEIHEGALDTDIKVIHYDELDNSQGESDAPAASRAPADKSAEHSSKGETDGVSIDEKEIDISNANSTASQNSAKADNSSDKKEAVKVESSMESSAADDSKADTGKSDDASIADTEKAGDGSTEGAGSIAETGEADSYTEETVATDNKMADETRTESAAAPKKQDPVYIIGAVFAAVILIIILLIYWKKRKNVKVNSLFIVFACAMMMSVSSAVCANELPQSCKLSMTSKIDGVDSEDTVANLTGGGIYENGTEVTVTAAYKEGFSFKGWYESGSDEGSQPLSYKLSYTFTVKADMNLVAVYISNEKLNVTVNGDSNAYSVGGVKQASNSYMSSFKAGKIMKLAYIGSGEFCYWKNSSGKIVSTEREYSFTLVNTTSISAVTVCKIGSEERGYSALVEFVSSYGQVLEAKTWNSKENADGKVLPLPPSRPDGRFRCWSIDGETEADARTILAAITSEVSRITVKPLYVQDESCCSVTVKYPSDFNKPDKVYDNQKIGSVLTVTADTIEGKAFAYWSSDAAGECVLSYMQDYSMIVSRDVALYPVYTDEKGEENPVVAMTNLSAKTEDSIRKLCFEITRSIPERYELLEQGMIYSLSDKYADESADMLIGSADVSRLVSSNINRNGVFICYMNVTANVSSTVYARGYAVIRDTETGNIETLYTLKTAGCYKDIAND